MEQIDKIVKSKIAPKNKNVLWDNGSDLMIYRNGRWDKAVKVMSAEMTERVITILDNHKESIIEFTQDSSHNLELAKSLDLTTNYICNYKISDEEILHGTYYNGVITTFYDGFLTEFNVDYNTGDIRVLKQVDPDYIAQIVHLSVCSSGTPEAALNLERLRRFSGDFFLCDITYGIGVGNFNNGTGGKAHITTPDGNEEYYTINVDGSVQTDASKKSLIERITALEEILL